jgi:magnesium chelatase family protein
MTVEHIDYEKLSNGTAAESSDIIRRRIIAARERQAQRFGNRTMLNSHMTARHLEDLSLSSEVRTLLQESAKTLKLSPRAYHRMIKLARTIADLEQSDDILAEHILEAFQYRPRLS